METELYNITDKHRSNLTGKKASKILGLQDDGVYHIRVLDSQIERHTPGGCNRVAADLIPRDAGEAVAVVHHDHGQKCGHSRAKRMPGENHIVVAARLYPEPAEGVGLLAENPDRRIQEAVVDVAAVKHLLSQVIVQKKLVVTLFGKIKAADGEHDLAVVVVAINEVRGRVTKGLLVGEALDNPVRVESVAAGGGELGVAEIRLVDGEDEAADAGHALELLRGS